MVVDVGLVGGGLLLCWRVASVAGCWATQQEVAGRLGVCYLVPALFAVMTSKKNRHSESQALGKFF